MWHNMFLITVLITIPTPAATVPQVHAVDISGTVLLNDNEQTKPAANVWVVLRHQPNGSERIEATDAQGQFRFANVLSDHYEIRLHRNGFAINHGERKSPFKNYVFPREPIEIDTRNPGPHVIEFILHRAATIEGRAVRADDQPLARAMVGIVDGDRFGEFEPNTGHFIIYGVPPSKPQRVLVTATAPEEYIYGQYIDLNAEQLKPGETVDVGTIRFDPLPPESNLKGTLMDADGNPTTGMRIYPLVHTSLPIQTSLVVIEGKIDQAVLPGEYKMVTGRDPNHVLAEITIQAQGITEVKLQDDRPVKQKRDDVPE